MYLYIYIYTYYGKGISPGFLRITVCAYILYKYRCHIILQICMESKHHILGRHLLWGTTTSGFHGNLQLSRWLTKRHAFRDKSPNSIHLPWNEFGLPGVAVLRAHLELLPQYAEVPPIGTCVVGLDTGCYIEDLKGPGGLTQQHNPSPVGALYGKSYFSPTQNKANKALHGSELKGFLRTTTVFPCLSPESIF